MKFYHTDGGRSAAGFKGEAGDCFVRAVSIATGMQYAEAYKALNKLAADEKRRSKSGRGSSAREGVFSSTAKTFMESIGWKWTPTMKVGSGCKVHMRSDELPDGRIIVRLSRHYAAVVDGVLYDNHDCSRDGTRCVYGYWHQ